MSTNNIELLDGIVLKKDLYKDNVLLLKKGSVINAYIVTKLLNFGITLVPQSLNLLQKNILEKSKQEILIIQKNKFSALKTRDILKYANFNAEKISISNDMAVLKKKEKYMNLSYIFIDKELYNENFINEVSLINDLKLKIFVLNCEDSCPKKVSFNSDYISVIFLRKRLEKNYIKALMNLYA